ncbi:uncharacterized protein [Haliotis asinina]|uniref:uncharacterized protein n=1 Tax=Haliotis asinina TaxID=109174 RepID=UPI003532405B
MSFLQDSDGTDSEGDDTGSTPGLYYLSDSGSNVAEEEEPVRISNEFDPALEVIHHRNRHHKPDSTEDPDDIHQNGDGQTQGAVTLTRGETQDLSTAIAEAFRNAIPQANAEQQVMNIVINNPQLNLTKKTEVAKLTAHNVSLGGQQVIQPSRSSDADESRQNTQSRPTEVPKDPEIQRIKDATVLEIYTRTSGMIKTQIVDDIVKRIGAGQNWITVTGNAGAGKTTVAYMVLNEMMKQGQNVFRVKTVADYYIITKYTDQCVIMMNDVVGAFALDNLAFSTWRPVIFDVMEKISTAKESGKVCEVTCVFVQRSNILKEVERCLEKHTSSILGRNAVTILSRLPEKEQSAILDYHLNQKNVKDVPEREKRKVIGKSIPYGFPHCCKLFAELKSKGKQDDIVQFFDSPLEILDATTDAYLENEKLKYLFKTLLQKDGRLDTSVIEDDGQRSDILEVSSPLTGSYLSNTEGIITFAHPSIYESVANCIGEGDVVFALKYFSLSLIREKMRFAASHSHDINVSRSIITVPPTPENIQRLCLRFTSSVLERQFDVLGHPFFQNKAFCRAFFPSIIQADSFWNNSKWFCWKQTGRIPIDEQNEEGRTMLSTVLLCGNVTAARVLLKHGADVNKTDLRGQTTLHYLCERGNADATVLQLMLQHGADVNKTDGYGITAFHYLSVSDGLDACVVELMIQHGADVNKTDEDGNTAFHYLCEKGDVDASIFELMIQHGADVNKTDDAGKTAFHYLFERGKVDVSVVELMIQHGADVNKTDEDGNTAFHYLCEKGDVDASIFELMIQHGADVNKTDDAGKTAFHYLCERSYLDVNVVELMIRHGADVMKHDSHGKTAFLYLCQKFDVSVVEMMIQHEAVVNKTDRFGKTVFHYLCERFDLDACVVELMIQHGADVSKTDEYGNTAFHYLCERRDVDASIFELMIQHGADVNKTNDAGKTAFHCLCERRDVDASIFELMIQHGADVNKTNDAGKTAFHCLCERRDVDASIFELMIQHGADVNKTDDAGKTAFHCLCETGDVDASIFELMIQHGADVNKTDDAGKTAFHCLCETGDVDASVFELMIQHGADVNKTDDAGKTAFHCLCETGDVDASVFELMIQHGADVNKTDFAGKTAFDSMMERLCIDR